MEENQKKRAASRSSNANRNSGSAKPSLNAQIENLREKKANKVLSLRINVDDSPQKTLPPDISGQIVKEMDKE